MSGISFIRTRQEEDLVDPTRGSFLFFFSPPLFPFLWLNSIKRIPESVLSYHGLEKLRGRMASERFFFLSFPGERKHTRTDSTFSPIFPPVLSELSFWCFTRRRILPTMRLITSRKMRSPGSGKCIVTTRGTYFWYNCFAFLIYRIIFYYSCFVVSNRVMFSLSLSEKVYSSKYPIKIEYSSKVIFFF